MTPCELNAIITAISNYYYINLSHKDFNRLAVLLSLISKQMFALVAMREVCNRDNRRATETAVIAEAID